MPGVSRYDNINCLVSHDVCLVSSDMIMLFTSDSRYNYVACPFSQGVIMLFVHCLKYDHAVSLSHHILSCFYVSQDMYDHVFAWCLHTWSICLPVLRCVSPPGSVSKYDVCLVSSDMACVDFFEPCILRHRILFWSGGTHRTNSVTQIVG